MSPERNHARNPASPAAEKKQKRHLNLSQEKREAQREQRRLYKVNQRLSETEANMLNGI
jgi:hypothetical protein